MYITCVSVTFSNFAISDLSLLLKYFLNSNCFSNSNICRPVKVVLAFFFLILQSPSSISSDGKGVDNDGVTFLLLFTTEFVSF